VSQAGEQSELIGWHHIFEAQHADDAPLQVPCLTAAGDGFARAEGHARPGGRYRAVVLPRLIQRMIERYDGEARERIRAAPRCSGVVDIQAVARRMTARDMAVAAEDHVAVDRRAARPCAIIRRCLSFEEDIDRDDQRIIPLVHLSSASDSLDRSASSPVSHDPVLSTTEKHDRFGADGLWHAKANHWQPISYNRITLVEPLICPRLYLPPCISRG